jgi:hypothetical protein
VNAESCLAEAMKCFTGSVSDSFRQIATTETADKGGFNGINFKRGPTNGSQGTRNQSKSSPSLDGRPMIETLPLEQAADAYACMMQGKARFRMVLVTKDGVA